VSWQSVARVLHCSKAKGTAKLVLVKIAELDRDDGRAVYPSVSTLAKAGNCSERQVQRVLRILQKIGELKVVYATGRNNTNTYILLIKGDIQDSISDISDRGDISEKATSKVIKGDNLLLNGDISTEKGDTSDTRTINTHKTINTQKEHSRSKKFVKPTVAELAAEFRQKGHPNPDRQAEKFYNHYESKGEVWLVGKSPMKNWKAAIANQWMDGVENKPPKGGIERLAL